jgi:4-cresol dehydrogenase (hydroxylating)
MSLTTAQEVQDKKPPNVSEGEFSAALVQFRKALGTEWVFTSTEELALYRDAYSPFWDQPRSDWGNAGVPVTAADVAKLRSVNRAD